MAAQKGKSLLLKVDTTEAGNFVTVAGLRSRSVAFGAETVDITDQDSAGEWRELLSGAGVKSARIAGSGIFKDAETDETIRGLFFTGSIRDWQVVVPDFGVIEGAFQIASFELSGDHNREVSFEIDLQSAGALSFVADQTSSS